MFLKLALGAFFFMLTACAKHATYKDFEDPLLFQDQDGGGFGGSEYKSGLYLAVWPDGRILKAVSAFWIGHSYKYGKLSAEDLEKVVALTLQLKQGYEECSPIGIDAPYRRLYAFPPGLNSSSAPIVAYEIATTLPQSCSIAAEIEGILEMGILHGRVITWDQIPRFRPGVWGDWAIPLERELEHNYSPSRPAPPAAD